MPRARASWIVTGIITTTTGVLETKADEMITKPVSSASTRTGRSSARDSAILVNHCKAPVRTRPPMTINIIAMVQGAGFDKTPMARS